MESFCCGLNLADVSKEVFYANRVLKELYGHKIRADV